MASQRPGRDAGAPRRFRSGGGFATAAFLWGDLPPCGPRYEPVRLGSRFDTNIDAEDAPVALVELTERAEKSLLDILERTNRLDRTLLVVDLDDSGSAQLSLKSRNDLQGLQRDIDMVGPFRVPVGSQRVPVFVRVPETGDRPAGRYEVDYYACGGRACFQIRAREAVALRAD